MKPNDKNMTILAEKSGLTFEVGNDDRLFFNDEERIDVHAPTIGEESYLEMESKISKLEIVKSKYTVYAWNDCSGFEYWNQEDELNYIIVTVLIKDADMTAEEIEQMVSDCEELESEFLEYDSIDGYIETLNKRGA